MNKENNEVGNETAFGSLETLIEIANYSLREIVFHSDGRVIAKSGGKAKHPKRLYTAKPKETLFSWSALAKVAVEKLIIDNDLMPENVNAEYQIKKHFSELGKKSWEKRKASLLQVNKQN